MLEMFHLDIHAWIEAQQTSHGVRHDDYAQYHGYCTRRLARLSHEKEAQQYLVHSHKFASPLPTTTSETDTNQSNNIYNNKSQKKKKSAGSRHAFCTRSHDTLALTALNEESGEKVPVPVPHINILWYLLVSAERCWAHSNQLQKSGDAKRQQVLKKLKRATEWADLLLQKAQASADSSTIKECQAYCAWMSANYAMEKLKYQVRLF
jgi:RNA-binding signal recognition particle 68